MEGAGSVEDNGLDTKSLFKTHFVCWRLLGMLPPKRFRPLYWFYSFLITVFVTVCYPLHLMLGLVTSTSMYEVTQNLAINITCTVCAMKTIAIWWRLNEVDVIFDIIRRQDNRTRSAEELKYMRGTVHPPVRYIIILFYLLCSSVAITGESSILFYGLRGDWRLMYQAYFPFDAFGSTWNYVVAHIYQFIGVSYIILMNLVNDTFAGAHLALLRGQVHLLGMRVAKIGHDPKKTLAENNQDLLECIRDHLDLLEHIPKAKATAIADTPELKRIAENTKIQSNVKYHEDFEKAKGKFTQVADDPETLRIKQNTKIISNVAYHGDLEKKAAMEKQRGAAEASDHTKDESEYFSEQLAAEQFAAQYAPQIHASHSPLPPQQLSPRLTNTAMAQAQQQQQQQQAQPQHQYHYTTSTTPQQQQTMPPPNIQHQQHNKAHLVTGQGGTTQIYHQNNSRQAQAQAQAQQQQHSYATSHLQQPQQFIQHEQQQQQQQQYQQHYQQPQMLRQPQNQQQQQHVLKQSSHLYPSSSSSSSTAGNLQQQQHQQQQQQQLSSQYQQPSNSYNQLRSAILQSSHHPTGAIHAGDPSVPLTPASIPTAAASSSYNNTYDQYDNTNYATTTTPNTITPTNNRPSAQAQLFQQQHHNNNNHTNNNNGGLVNVQSYQAQKSSAATTPNYGSSGGGGGAPTSTLTAQQQLYPNNAYNSYQTLSSSAHNGSGQQQASAQQQTLSQQSLHNHHHTSSNGGGGAAVINGSIGKIADYDPLTDGPRPLPNTSRSSTTLIYSSDSRGNVNNSYAKRIGSVADIDPVNGIYGSLTAEQQQQQQQHMSNHNVPQQQQYYHQQQQQMPVMHQQQQQQQQQQNHQSHHSLQQQKQTKQNLRIYRALYDYEAQDVDEVGFREGDIIFEVESIDSGWMTGRVERTGKTGMLPANYVEHAVI